MATQEKIAKPTPSTPAAPPVVVVMPPNQSQVTDAKTTVDEAGNIPEKDDVDVETLIPKDSYQTDPLFYAISDYFNIPPEEYHIAKDYLSEITDYLIRETKSNNPSKLLAKMREIEDVVQPPQWGEKRYWNVRKYVRLASRKGEIEKAMSAFTKK